MSKNPTEFSPYGLRAAPLGFFSLPFLANDVLSSAHQKTISDNNKGKYHVK